ncbi:MBL fold metallo-hydrolase [Streptomyces sp. B1866]|uniref:MBL fold metallo-hydrolase n=1 Tax=Streptomyces sp. B1866 TaxID=3075431 RepID=UPI00289212C3|nr:MBL fold metallo-hydrolase [Streptomyces sp. B1866]MDT3395662.1 MBL fold metallo-hydrolase [Streptomyces sp. B1866]
METCREEPGTESEAERLAPGVVRWRLPGWDATAGAVAGAAGVLVVDTGSSLREGAWIRRRVTRLLGRRPTHVALTHAHFDHVLGTGAFAGCAVYGAAGLAGPLCEGREAVGADAVRYGADPAAAAEAADLLVHPPRPVTGELAVDLGGRSVLLADVGPGHTAHDLAVVVPGRPRVVFCGDLVEESGPPQAGPDALPDRWPAALDRLLALGGEDAVYVPGHGSAVDADFVRTQRDALAARFGGRG